MERTLVKLWLMSRRVMRQWSGPAGTGICVMYVYMYSGVYV